MDSIPAILERIATARNPMDVRGSRYVPVCELILELGIAGERSDADLAIAAERLEELFIQGHQLNPYVNLAATMALVEAWKALGEVDKALQTVRRRWNTHDPFAVAGLSRFLLEEARLAAAVADTAGAVTAYRHYLALRFDPEPAQLAERDSAEVELQALIRAGGG
jgi:hypothetical protein